MKEKKIVLVLITVVFVLIVGAGFAYNFLAKENGKDNLMPAPGEETSQAEGEASENQLVKAPDFTVTDKDGHEVLLSDFLGKPVVINFWATWCGYCKQEMPAFDEIYKEMGEDVVFMMVNATDGKRETVEKAAAFIEKEGYSFPVYYDTLSEASSLYGVSSLPMTFFIDDEGNAVTYAAGALDKDTLVKGITFITEK